MSVPHLPPPAVWADAQRRARACGLWLDLTMDGVYHVYRLSDNQEHTRRDDWLGALSLLGAIEAGRMVQLQLFEVAA